MRRPRLRWRWLRAAATCAALVGLVVSSTAAQIATAPAAAAAGTLDGFVAAHPAGTSYGSGQCVALVNGYLSAVYGFDTAGQGVATASDMAQGRSGAHVFSDRGWTWSADSNPATFHDGDVLVWSYSGGSTAGHTAIWYQDGLYEQNAHIPPGGTISRDPWSWMSRATYAGRWIPPGGSTPPTTQDRDGDGVPDASDRCPDAPGPAALNGCPDTDGDGMADIDDACPQWGQLIGATGCSLDSDGNGIPDAEELRRKVDVNHDGLPDVVGFANAGVVVSLNTGHSFRTAKLWSRQFGWAAEAGGWRVESHSRMLTDVNHDGLPDVVGFANAGVVVSLNTGHSFRTAKLWSRQFGWAAEAGGWRVESHPRMLTDVNHDGLPDVVGFANAGVVVSLNTGHSFRTAKLWIRQFGWAAEAGGWRVQLQPRY